MAGALVGLAGAWPYKALGEESRISGTGGEHPYVAWAPGEFLGRSLLVLWSVTQACPLERSTRAYLTNLCLSSRRRTAAAVRDSGLASLCPRSIVSVAWHSQGGPMCGIREAGSVAVSGITKSFGWRTCLCRAVPESHVRVTNTWKLRASVTGSQRGGTY